MRFRLVLNLYPPVMRDKEIKSNDQAISLTILAITLLISVFAISSPYLHNLFRGKELSKTDSSVVLGLDFSGGMRVVYELQESEFDKLDADEAIKLLEESKAILIERLSDIGEFEPSIRVVHDQRQIILELPGVSNDEEIAERIGQTGKLELYSLTEEGVEYVERYLTVYPDSAFVIPDRMLKSFLMTKADLKAVYVDTNPVRVRLDLEKTEGRNVKIFEELSENAGGKVAVMISGKVRHVIGISKTLSRARIYDGKVIGYDKINQGDNELVISSDQNMSVESANETAEILNWKVLPANLIIKNRVRIGAVMSDEQYYLGMGALILGAIFILILFLILYGTFLGTVGSIILIYSGLMIYGFFSIWGLVLNLPGLAGLILTVGISVDSLILIFESIKDTIRERLKRKMLPLEEDTLISCISKNTKRLFTLRITTLVGTLVLAIYPGPMRGFAIVMIVGLVVSMLVSNRFFIGGLLKFSSSILGGDNVNSVTYGLPVWENHNVEELYRKLLRNKKIIGRVSTVLALVAIAIVMIVGLNLSTDFRDGTQLQYLFAEPVSKEQLQIEIAAYLDIENLRVHSIQELRSETPQTRYLVKSDPMELKQVQELAGIFSRKGWAAEREFEATVSGTVSQKELIFWSLLTVASFLAVFLVCLLPFTNIRVGNNSILPASITIGAIIHDIAIIVGIVSIFHIELSVPVFTAILLLIGYSVNDSLVLIFQVNKNYEELQRRENEYILPISEGFENVIDEILERAKAYYGRAYPDFGHLGLAARQELSPEYTQIATEASDLESDLSEVLRSIKAQQDPSQIIGEFSTKFITFLSGLARMGIETEDVKGVFPQIMDRINQYVVRKPEFHQDYVIIVDNSLLEIRSRTINTTLTTMIGLIPILLLGTGFIKAFIFTIIIGLIVGIFSSTFLVGSVLDNMINRKMKPKIVNSSDPKTSEPII